METESNPHHLVLGELTDFLSGAVLCDTFDERFRQKIAKKLVLENGFGKDQIQSNTRLTVKAGGKKAVLTIDFLIEIQARAVILIKYAPGSLVTRRLSTLALSRIIRPYQIPVVVITNGEDAEIMDGETGKVLSDGFKNIPDINTIESRMRSYLFQPVDEKQFDQASRIAYACEIDGACPCDSDICVIE